MKTNADSFEQMGKSIMGKIYPFLINDLKNLYNKPFTNKTIAEIGSGPGFILKELQKEDFSKIYGIDISLDMLSRATKRINTNEKILLINAKAEQLPLKDQSLDIIISRGSVFFWKDLEKAFNEIYRVLKKDGFAIIGGGYGISTPDDIINEIITYYNSEMNKNKKPKLDLDKMINIMNKIGGKQQIINKPRHGFWITWNK